MAEAPLTITQARLLHLAAQGLLAPPRRKAKREQLLAAIRRMQLLQIDTIHVVNRSPYLVLFARIGAFPLEWLEQSLAEARLIECWAHEACFAPVDDFPLHRAHQRGRRHWSQRIAARSQDSHAAEITALVARIGSEGAMRASDFERETPASGGWWGWKPEKRWLETAFAQGELMIARRERFQRIYDVPQRVLASRPELLAAPDPSPEDLRRTWILAAVKALGISKARWIADYFRLDGKVSEAELEPLVATGALRRLTVADWAEPVYLHPDLEPVLAQARLQQLIASHTCALSPFDPLVWDRERAACLFGFDYRLECYTPAAKRQHGYFVLPLLDRERIVGRLDAKAHRAEGVFEIKRLSLEPGVRPGSGLAGRLHRALSQMATWHGTPLLQFGEIEPAAMRELLLTR